MTPDELLAEHTPDVEALGQRLRRFIREAVPEATEKAYPGWHGIGYRHPIAGYFAGIFPLEDSVRLLFEHGVLLPDPEHVLAGDGSQTRHVDLTEWTESLVPVLEDLVAAAVELRS